MSLYTQHMGFIKKTFLSLSLLALGLFSVGWSLYAQPDSNPKNVVLYIKIKILWER
jgi:hypothetical protein